MSRWRRIVLLWLVGAVAFTESVSPSVAVGPQTRPPPPPIRPQPPPPPASGSETRPLPPGVAGRPSESDTALEREIHERVNRYRSERGLAPFTLDARISEQARHHSGAMATGRVRVGHEGFKDRIHVLQQEMKVGWSAENVGMSQGYADPAQQAVAGWLASPAHRESIEGRYHFTGIGVVRNRAGAIYFTQIFVGQ
jgi:uncharacterized protein YkwD